MMKALYLYAIRKQSNIKHGISDKGISGGAVKIIQYKDLEAVVSLLDPKKFSPGAVKKQSQDDIEWIVKHAKVHERIVEKAMHTRSHAIAVIPMKFGTIFRTEKNLISMMRSSYSDFKNILDSLEHQEEWGLKVYAKEAQLKKKLKKDTTYKQNGKDYFDELKSAKKFETEFHEFISAHTSQFFNELKSCARLARRNKNLAKEFVGKEEPMMLNAAFLVDENSRPLFRKMIGELKKSNSLFIFEVTGPWPPYNFIDTTDLNSARKEALSA
jgi:hypothetical protein